MINYIQLENFKSIKKLSLPVENLNLFFGMNGMGKSSVIQALLLLRQSFWENHELSLDCLYTNGDMIQLGTGKDIFCQSGVSEIIRFYVQYTNNIKFDCCYKYELNNPNSDQLMRVGERLEGDYSVSLFSGQFSYLGAEHLGPRKQYSIENWKRNGTAKLGTRGEFVVPFLALEGEKIRIPKEMCLPAGKTNRLIDQVSAWMAEILLVSEKDSLLLIENPESHLHPRGQTMMGKLIALAAEHGSQIICESHSDHVINGIRVAIKNKWIHNEKVEISFFSKNKEQETKVNNIYVDKKGNLSDYPLGLLDEWGILMTELM